MQATNGIRSVCNTNRLKAVPLRFVRQAWPTTRRSRLYYAHKGSRTAKNKRTSACISKMKAKFLSCGKRSTKNQGEQLQLVVVEAKGACVRRKLGAPRLAAVAARNPSSNTHIPCIRTLRIGVRSGVGVPPKTATELQYHLRKAQISLLPRATISRTLCVHITYIALRLALRISTFRV